VSTSPDAGTHPAGGGSGSGSSSGASSGSSSGVSGSGGEADSGSSSGFSDPPDSAALAAFLRIANWSPDSPVTGLDFCLAPHGTSSWAGPQLAGTSTPLTFPVVTSYVFVDPGKYDLAIVAAGATDCSSPLVPPVTNLPVLTPNNAFTIALVGDTTVAGSDRSLTAWGFEDDTAPGGLSEPGPVQGPPTNANVRFLDAAPGLDTTTIDFGTGTLAARDETTLETSVAFGALPTKAGTSTAQIDGNGYVSVNPIGAAVLSAHVTGTATDLATASNQALPSGATVTAVLINGKTGGLPPSFLVCTGDGSDDGTNALSSCVQVSH
jgi:hypothetical protein